MIPCASAISTRWRNTLTTVRKSEVDRSSFPPQWRMNDPKLNGNWNYLTSVSPFFNRRLGHGVKKLFVEEIN
jgi:hypothetical protein